MSYDINIAGESFNYTSNVGALWYDYLDEQDGLKSLDGLTGKQAAARLSKFWSRVQDSRHRNYSEGVPGEPALCAKYDSPNGWGSLVGALILTGQIHSACATNPRHKVSVSA